MQIIPWKEQTAGAFARECREADDLVYVPKIKVPGAIPGLKVGFQTATGWTLALGTVQFTRPDKVIVRVTKYYD